MRTDDPENDHQQAAHHDELMQTLHPDLRAWVQHTLEFGPIVHSPWTISLGVNPDGRSSMNGAANLSYEAARERIRALRTAGNLPGVIFATTRPYRSSLFGQLQDEMDDATYWRTLARVWIDAENPDEGPNSDFAHWFTSPRPKQSRLMSDEELEAFRGLPDPVRLYRGGAPGAEVGLAWTTKKNIAEWFAQRFQGDPDQQQVFERVVPKRFVIAYFTRRDEHEVIVHPTYWQRSA